MNFLEKLDFLMKEKGISRSVLSKESGIPYTTIDGFYKKGYENAKLSTIKKLSRYFNITMDELICDGLCPVKSNQVTGNSINQNNKMPDVFAKKYYSLDKYGQKTVNVVLDAEYERCTSIIEEDEETQEIEIKHSYYKVSAGIGFSLGNDDEWETIYIPDSNENRKADFALTIQGDSMEPVYYDGDIVLVKEQPAIDIGQIGIYMIEGKGYIKKYGGDRLISLNAKYDDIIFSEYDDERIRCVGKVIGRV